MVRVSFVDPEGSGPFRFELRAVVRFEVCAVPQYLFSYLKAASGIMGIRWGHELNRSDGEILQLSHELIVVRGSARHSAVQPLEGGCATFVLSLAIRE